MIQINSKKDIFLNWFKNRPDKWKIHNDNILWVEAISDEYSAIFTYDEKIDSFSLNFIKEINGAFDSTIINNLKIINPNKFLQVLSLLDLDY